MGCKYDYNNNLLNELANTEIISKHTSLLHSKCVNIALAFNFFLNSSDCNLLTSFNQFQTKFSEQCNIYTTSTLVTRIAFGEQE